MISETCRIQWSNLLKEDIFICGLIKKISRHEKIYKQMVNNNLILAEVVVIVGVVALTGLAWYACRKKPAPLQPPNRLDPIVQLLELFDRALQGNNGARLDLQIIRPLMEQVIENLFIEIIVRRLERKSVDKEVELSLRDKDGKTIADYLGVDLPEPPKSFQVPKAIIKQLEKKDDFPKFICPLTKKLILYPVLDPTDRTTLYEKEAIEVFARENGKSPITEQSLAENQLLEVPIIGSLIRKKLYFYPLEIARENKKKILSDDNYESNIKDERNKTYLEYPIDANLVPPDNFQLPAELRDELEESPDFPQYKCAISHCLIVDPVLDPTDGGTLYDRSQIEKHLRDNPTSPTTRQALDIGCLVELPSIAQRIKQKYFEHLKKTE